MHHFKYHLQTAKRLANLRILPESKIIQEHEEQLEYSRSLHQSLTDKENINQPAKVDEPEVQERLQQPPITEQIDTSSKRVKQPALENLEDEKNEHCADVKI